MSQSKDEKHLSTPPLRQEGLEEFGRKLTQRAGLNRAPFPAADPVKLRNRYAAVHEPGQALWLSHERIPGWEWNLDQTLPSTIPRSE